MAGRNIVITGANTGIGYELALHCARGGDHVVMACRNSEKAGRAQRRILEVVPQAAISVIPLDISELESVREFGHRYADQVGDLDILINNAGVVAQPLSRTRAGHEMQLATNYTGIFALTGTLLPFFRHAAPGRIVNVGSLTHLLGELDLSDLNWEKKAYDEWQAYYISKLALLVYTFELDRRLRCSGRSVVALAAHPGTANTEIGNHRASLSDERPVSKWFHEQVRKIIPSASSAARSIIVAASDEDVRGGEYYGPNFVIAGRPRRARVRSITRDLGIGRRLWEISESMTGVRYLSDV